MTKKYIQNCTGDICSDGENKAGRDIVSAKTGRIIFFVLLVGFVSVSVYMVLFSQYLQIVNVDVLGTRELDAANLKQKLEDSLQGKFFGAIPKNNFLFVSQKNIEAALLNDFKKIRSLKVVKKFPDTVSIEIEERKALLVWCSGEKCFLIDENGYAYNEADFNSPELVQNHLLQINETNGQDVAIGSKIIDPAYEKYVLGIKDALFAMGFNLTDQYSTPSRMAEEISVKTDQDSELHFSTQFSLDSALRTLSLILKKEIPEEKRNDIAYIDLRNENKAFYKFKNAQQPTTENQPVTEAEVKKNR
ncbi:MAG: FtsQ-type POTRA domain-containing protein [Candidatus Moranbacteria bacterium]|nr:FtsQ-type POTRA domain-containing protein [Candidatus Moranbacteria bacterium]